MDPMCYLKCCMKNISVWRLLNIVERIQQFMTLQCTVCIAAALALLEVVYFLLYILKCTVYFAHCT
jgi:hypothetical protein